MADRNAIDHASSVSLGITVALLYVLFVTSVFAGFATYIYRTEWAVNLSPAGTDDAQQIKDIDNLIFVINRERTLNQKKREVRQLQTELLAKRFDIDAEYNQIERVLAEAERDVQSKAKEMLAGLRDSVPSLPDGDQKSVRSVFENPYDTEVERARKAVQLVPILKPRDIPVEEAPNPAYQDTLDQLVAELLKVDALIDEFEDKLYLNRQAETLNAIHIDRADLEESEIQRQLDALLVRLPPGSTDRARLAALSMDVPVVGEMFQKLVSFPTIFLTLIVTIAAGGLGTVVSFSRRYYAGHDNGLTLSRLFVNVGEGIAAAIAIFLFSGAGMLALTQGGGNANEVELSPYTVAFVAFLSGFMAEDAFASIQTAGKRIFGRDGKDKDDDGGEATA